MAFKYQFTRDRNKSIARSLTHESSLLTLFTFILVHFTRMRRRNKSANSICGKECWINQLQTRWNNTLLCRYYRSLFRPLRIYKIMTYDNKCVLKIYICTTFHLINNQWSQYASVGKSVNDPAIDWFLRTKETNQSQVP